MTAAAFRSLESTMFATLTRARRDYADAARRYDIAQDACTCSKVCSCPANERGAWAAYQAAAADRAEREAAWVAYLAAR